MSNSSRTFVQVPGCSCLKTGQLEKTSHFSAPSVPVEHIAGSTFLPGLTDQVQHMGATAPPGSYVILSYGVVLQVDEGFLVKGLAALP